MICLLLACLAIVTYFLKNLAGSLQCSEIPIVLYIESIIDKGPGVLGHFIYNASITFPISQTDRKQGRPIRLHTAPLLPRPGPLFVCRKEFMGMEGTTLRGL